MHQLVSNKKTILLILLLTAYPSLVKVFAQKQPRLYTNHITTQQGLSSNNVDQILQDEEGFIWILTGNGISRYDGYSFKYFGYDPNDSNAVLPNSFYGDIDNKNRKIWFCSNDNQGFYSFNMKTGIFNHYVNDPQYPNSVDIGNNDGNLVVDTNGIVWIATSKGLSSFDPEKKSFRHFTHYPGDNTSIQCNNITQVERDEAGNLWLAMEQDGTEIVDYFNSRTGKVIQHINGQSFLPPKMKKRIQYVIGRGRNGNIWFATEIDGVYGYNIYTKKSMHLVHDSRDPRSIHAGSYNLLEDHLGNLWIFNTQNIIDHVDMKSGVVRFIPSLEDSSNREQEVNCIFEDKAGMIWVGTTNDGMYNFDIHQNKFHAVNNRSDDPQSIPSNYAKFIVQFRNGQLFLGTRNGIASVSGNNILRKPGSIFNVYEDRDGNTWLTTETGIIRFIPEIGLHHPHSWVTTKSGNIKFSPGIGFDHYRFYHTDSNCRNGNIFYGFLQDLKGRFWVKSLLGEMASFDAQSGTFRYIKTNRSDSMIGRSRVFKMKLQKDGNIFIASRGEGYIIFNPDKELFKRYHHQIKDPNSLSCDNVYDYIEDNKGTVWLATYGGGLNAFNPANGKFKAFTTDEGLRDNNITNLVADKTGDLWLGTDQGITRFTPPANPFLSTCKIKFRNYNTGDGLPANQTAIHTSLCAQDGNIWFGTVDQGFFYFNPEDLKDNPVPPKVYITGFNFFNHPVHPGDSTNILLAPIESTMHIKLRHDQNVISFSFTALNYNQPEKNKFAYKLVNFDKDWIYTDAAKRYANYTNLNAGEYTFLVKGSNNDALWNETPVSIELTITPPFTQTWLFRILVVLSVAGAVYALYSYRLQQALRLLNLRNRIASDLHDDIGSTLSSISIMSELAKDRSPQARTLLDAIGESASNIQENMSDLVWTVNPKNDHFENIIQRMNQFASKIMEARSIDYHFIAGETVSTERLSMDQRKKVYMFFKEAINNAAKYSNANRVDVTLSSLKNNILLTIEDNGRGFDISQHNAGNGLSNFKRRAEELGGEARIVSAPGKGTKIHLSFKIS